MNLLDSYSNNAWGRQHQHVVGDLSVHEINNAVLLFFETREGCLYTIPFGQRARVLQAT